MSAALPRYAHGLLRLVVLLCLCSLFCTQLHADELPIGSHATLTYCLYDIQASRNLMSRDEQRAVLPASVQKLLTTATAFARLGSNYRYPTRLLARGDVDRDGVLHGDLYIEGSGDPLLGSYRYRQTSADTLFALWTAALRGRGVSRVDGRIYYCASCFDSQQLHDTWQHGDVGNYYGAGVTGLNFHENMYFVHFNAAAREGEPAAVVRTTPAWLSLKEDNQVTTGPAASGDRVVCYGLPQSYERYYRGTVPLGQHDFRVRAALPNPPRTCATLFATYLRSHGISVSLDASEAPTLPDSLRTISEYFSPNLRLIAQYTNHTSNNIYAESLFKTLGHRQQGVGSYEGGARAVEQYIDEKGIDREGIRIVDGSGLSRSNQLTASFLCRFLAAVSREPWFEDYLATLPQAGKSGTARTLFPNLPAGTVVFVKTGSMEGVRTMAGYINRGGRRYAFAILASGHTCSSADATRHLSDILLSMVQTI